MEALIKVLKRCNNVISEKSLRDDPQYRNLDHSYTVSIKKEKLKFILFPFVCHCYPLKLNLDYHHYHSPFLYTGCMFFNYYTYS